MNVNEISLNNTKSNIHGTFSSYNYVFLFSRVGPAWSSGRTMLDGFMDLEARGWTLCESKQSY